MYQDTTVEKIKAIKVLSKDFGKIDGHILTVSQIKGNEIFSITLNGEDLNEFREILRESIMKGLELRKAILHSEINDINSIL